MKPNKEIKSKFFVELPFKFCICCGISGNLKYHTFEYHQENSIANFSKLAGGGLDVILGYALKKTFTVKAMFCERCGKRIEKVDFIGQIGHLIFVVLIFLTIVLATITHSTLGFEKSLYVVGLGILFTIGFKVWFSYYNWKYFPKIKRIDEKTVVLKIKGKGKLRFSRT